MDILGVGFSELIFVLIIALMVFGPKRLPEIAGKLGGYIAQLRSLSDGLMAEWQREINAANQLEELKKVNQDIKGIKENLTQTKSDLQQAKKDVDDGARSIAPKASLPRFSPPSTTPAETTATDKEPPPQADNPNKPDDGKDALTPDALSDSTEQAEAAPETKSKSRPDKDEPDTTVHNEKRQLPPATNGSSTVPSSKPSEVLGD